jgi:hypothetical protein
MPVQGAGRPSLLEIEPGLVAELELHLRNGNYINVSCDFVGIDVGLFRGWMRRGREELRRQRNAMRELSEAQRRLDGRMRNRNRAQLESELPELEAACELLPAEALYANFCTRMKRAMAQAEIGGVGIVNRAAMGVPGSEERIEQPDGTVITRRTEEIRPQWQAAAWRLERMYPTRWARRAPQQIQVTGKEGEPPVETNISGGADVVFYIPHNGRGELPAGMQVERNAPHRAPNGEPEG